MTNDNKPQMGKIPTKPGWYWFLPKLSEMFIREATWLNRAQLEQELINSIRVIRVDYRVVNDEQQLCAIHPGGAVPMTYHQESTWGPRVKGWTPDLCEWRKLRENAGIDYQIGSDNLPKKETP